MEFPAKVDWWFQLVFFGSGALMLLATPITRRTKGTLGAALLGILGVLFVAVGVQTTSVRYAITEDGYLDARGGWPLSGRITALSAIHTIEPSRDGRSSQAASLDRLRIDYGNDGLIFIAVHDKRSFLNAVAAKDPGLFRTKTGIRRTKKPTQ